MASAPEVEEAFYMCPYRDIHGIGVEGKVLIVDPYGAVYLFLFRSTVSTTVGFRHQHHHHRRRLPILGHSSYPRL